MHLKFGLTRGWPFKRGLLYINERYSFNLKINTHPCKYKAKFQMHLDRKILLNCHPHPSYEATFPLDCPFEFLEVIREGIVKNTIDLQNSLKFRDQHDEIENKEQ
jgi:hypothetical protein